MNKTWVKALGDAEDAMRKAWDEYTTHQLVVDALKAQCDHTYPDGEQMFFFRYTDDGKGYYCRFCDANILENEPLFESEMDTVKTYRRVGCREILEAIRFTDTSKDRVFNFASGQAISSRDINDNPTLEIHLNAGNSIIARFGDVLTKSSWDANTYAIFDYEVFRRLYEPVKDDS
jgi:hypothetical protein